MGIETVYGDRIDFPIGASPSMLRRVNIPEGVGEGVEI